MYVSSVRHAEHQPLTHMHPGNSLTLPLSETNLDVPETFEKDDDHDLKWDSDCPDVDRVMKVIQWGSTDDPYYSTSLAPTDVSSLIQDADLKARMLTVVMGGEAIDKSLALAANTLWVPERDAENVMLRGNQGNGTMWRGCTWSYHDIHGRACALSHVCRCDVTGRISIVIRRRSKRENPGDRVTSFISPACSLRAKLTRLLWGNYVRLWCYVHW